MLQCVCECELMFENVNVNWCLWMWLCGCIWNLCIWNRCIFVNVRNEKIGFFCPLVENVMFDGLDMGCVTPWILGYKNLFALYSKLRCYPFFYSLLFSLYQNSRELFWFYIGMSCKSVMIVAFMLLHSVSKCKKCLNHVNMSCRSLS